MKISFRYIIIVLMGFSLLGCDNDDDGTPKGPVDSKVDAPAKYSFEREGKNTVSFSGQTTRIKMAEELIGGMKDFDTATEAQLLEFFRNEVQGKEDQYPFDDETLNSSTKSIRSKVAASSDFFFSNATESTAIKNQFETWIKKQISEVLPNKDTEAKEGQAGQIADGNNARYVSAKGLEYNQAVNKGLMGALMADQMLNNYLSPSVLDNASDSLGTNREKNDKGILEEGKDYTAMEHKWDEAYGYIYGTATDVTDPNTTIGSDDSFLNKYIGKVDGDSDFKGIASDIFDAFKLGRAAIVAKEYGLRDLQAAIIQEKISEIIAIRAVHYLQQGKKALDQDTPDYGKAFHYISEGYGFIYSLRFTRQPDSTSPYFSRTEVDGFLTDLMDDGDNGLWNVKTTTLDDISKDIAAKFSFTVEEAAQ